MSEKDKDAASSAPPLCENELDDVSGGFTIIDTCKHVWSEMICNAVWGQCPNLKLTPAKDNNFLVSCEKGYFKNQEYGNNPI